MNTQILNSAKDSEPDSSGVLSQQAPLRTWAGRGTGAPCNLCGRAIQAHEVEYEIELAPATAGRSLRFHFNCYRAWELKSPRAKG